MSVIRVRIVGIIVCFVLLVGGVILSGVQARTIDEIHRVESLPLGELPDNLMQVRGHVAQGESGMFVQLVDSAERIIAETILDHDSNFAFSPIETGQYKIDVLSAERQPVTLKFEVVTVANRQPHPYLLQIGTQAIEEKQTPDVEAILSVGAIVIGRITDKETGQPPTTSNTNITAYDAISGNYINSTSTDNNGNYRLEGLSSSAIKLRFENNHYVYGGKYYSDEYYNQQQSKVDADPISVTVETTTTVDYQLRKAGTITGVVTASDTGEPLAGIYVRVYRMYPECDIYRQWVGSNQTDESGAYTIRGLPTGIYEVAFATSSLNLSNIYHSESRTNVTVQVEKTVPVNMTLQRGGIIQGRVTAEDTGGVLNNISVTFYRRDYSASNDQYYWLFDSSTETNANGYYTSTALIDSDYAVVFDTTPWSDSAPYIGEMYNNQLYNPYQANTTPTLVSVTSGTTVTGIDAVLERGVQVSGRVVAEGTGRPLEYIPVYVLQEVAGSSGNWYEWGHGITNDDGYYTTTGSPSGAARIHFYPRGGGSSHLYSYISEYYNNQTSFDDATTINLMTGQDITNIDASLANGGSIRGFITLSGGGYPNSDTVTTLYDSNGRPIAKSTYYDLNEGYKFEGLLPGTYYILFNNTSIWRPDLTCGSIIPYYGEYYGGASTFDEATPIVITGTEAHFNIDGQLSSNGSPPSPPESQTMHRVYGRVTDSYDRGLANVLIQAGTSQSTLTDSNGEYMLKLAAGEHTLLFYKEGYRFSFFSRITVSDNNHGYHSVGFEITPHRPYSVYIPIVTR